MSKPGSPSIKAILRAKDKMIGSAENVLSKLLRQVTYELGIGEKVFGMMVNRYLDDPNTGIGNNVNARINHRGNMIKEFGGSRITWPVFEKFLRVIGVSEYRIVLQLKRKNTYTEHILSVKNNIQEEVPEDLSKATVIDGFPTSGQTTEENNDTGITLNTNYISEEVRQKFKSK